MLREAKVYLGGKCASLFCCLKIYCENYNTKGCDTITNERKTRIVKDKAKQGTDCYTFEVSFQGDLKNLPKQPLINEQGKKYGSVEVKDKKSTVSLVLPKFIRDNNIQPFTIMDSICLEMINCDCDNQKSCCYITRNRIRDEKGLLREMEYTVYSSPKLNENYGNNPIVENPTPGNPTLDFPTQGKPTQ